MRAHFCVLAHAQPKKTVKIQWKDRETYLFLSNYTHTHTHIYIYIYIYIRVEWKMDFLEILHNTLGFLAPWVTDQNQMLLSGRNEREMLRFFTFTWQWLAKFLNFSNPIAIFQFSTNLFENNIFELFMKKPFIWI